MHKRYRLRNYDFKLIIFVCALTVIGIFAIGSAKPSLQMKQISGFALGLVLMIGLSLIDYHAILMLYWVLYVLNLIMLRLVSTMGTKVKGAQRWLQIGLEIIFAQTTHVRLITRRCIQLSTCQLNKVFREIKNDNKI